MKKSAWMIVFLLAIASMCFGQSEAPSLFQKPTVSRTHIVFSYAGDLWVVPRAGGDAKRLTTGIGIETDPFFSPSRCQSRRGISLDCRRAKPI